MGCGTSTVMQLRGPHQAAGIGEKFIDALGLFQTQIIIIQMIYPSSRRLNDFYFESSSIHVCITYFKPYMLSAAAALSFSMLA
jgi:hypothetical protein